MLRTPQERFFAKVLRTTTCWVWLGATKSKRAPYGILRVGGKGCAAHRLSWEWHKGPIPDGLWVLHKCDYHGCVNPDHLFLGTSQDNMLDALRKERYGRAKLTWEKVREIRRLHKTGVSSASLAAQFGVRYFAINRIVRGQTWKEHEES